MKTLEERVERCVNGFTKEISKVLIRKKDGGNNNEGNDYTISYLVQRQWNLQMCVNSVKVSELTPAYANAIVAMREKTTELAPEFLESYGHHLEHSEGVQGLLKRVFEQDIGKGIVAITAAAVTSWALKLYTPYRIPFGGGALIFSGALILVVLIQNYANMPNSRARQERSKFEEAVRAEFYRVAGRS
ncbi:hypothetical protein HYY73_02535 [Candidatus Woesearchaeota archaeon]|nr:hypothetical protein [Candidatus Woesearchaeota archaeon]